MVAGLHERDIFDLFLPEFDKPWVIHLRETCCVLQTSALGGPTLSTRIEAPVDINTIQIITKKDGAIMQRFELSPNDTIELLTREPS